MHFKIKDENKYIEFPNGYMSVEIINDNLVNTLNKYIPDKKDLFLEAFNIFEKINCNSSDNWAIPKAFVLQLKKEQTVYNYYDRATKLSTPLVMKRIGSLDDLQSFFKETYPIMLDCHKKLKQLQDLCSPAAKEQSDKREAWRSKNSYTTHGNNPYANALDEERVLWMKTGFNLSFFKTLKSLLEQNNIEALFEMDNSNKAIAVYLPNTEIWFSEKNRVASIEVNNATLFSSQELAKKRMSQVGNKEYILIPVELKLDLNHILKQGNFTMPKKMEKMISEAQSETLRSELTVENKSKKISTL